MKCGLFAIKKEQGNAVFAVRFTFSDEVFQFQSGHAVRVVKKTGL